jgi:hypothetical protein
MAVDETIGKVARFISYAHSAGAMLLLILPASNADLQDGADLKGNEDSGSELA